MASRLPALFRSHLRAKSRAMAAAPNGDVELAEPPQDGISSLQFSPFVPPLLLVGSWDAHVRVYDTQTNALRGVFAQKAAVLGVCWADRTVAYAGGLETTVKCIDIDAKTERVLGSHTKAVRCVEYSSDTGLVLSGGWDASLRLWDARAQNPAVGSFPQPDRVFAMDLAGARIVIACAGRAVNIWDLRKMSEPEQRRESSLKYQTRTVRAFPDKTGYALSSTEGRVAIEYFDPSPEAQARKYAFKCHRANINGVDTVYPVNALAFHPGFGTFASGGCDGIINFWDGQSQKRLKQLAKYPTSIAALSFNNDGSVLAVAASYTFEEGEKDHPQDSIFLHKIQEGEVKPKPRAG